MSDPAAVLNEARVEPEVFALRPDYRVMLVAATGLVPGAAPDAQAALTRAEASATELLASTQVTEVPHVAAWRETFGAFGAKPSKYRSSLESLLRRATTGLPRVNPLTDFYNALSVIHRIPAGGEDLGAYSGPPRLTRATGEEDFDTTAGGELLVEHPSPGEVIWRDDLGVTCRRWNWRQGRRTALGEDTTEALFIFDALSPVDDPTLHTVADELSEYLDRCGPAVRLARRLIAE